jgi:hypothetical protein
MDRGERQGIRTDASGRDRDGETGFGIKVFFVVFYCEVFCEEKENRTEERKKRGWGRPRGREKETIKWKATSAMTEYPTQTPDTRPPVTGVS